MREMTHQNNRKLKLRQGKFEAAIASEQSLKKDWLKQEDDEAWKDL
jgi:hypothetical protein